MSVEQEWRSKNKMFVSAKNFKRFTFSKKEHFTLFDYHDFDLELFGEKVDPEKSRLKVYSDLLIFSFIKFNLVPGMRMLEIGGGESRILKYFSRFFECWNIDKFEGFGNGPKTVKSSPFHKTVIGYIGEFSKELPDNYFDFVFSISVLEHIYDTSKYDNIVSDINRVRKKDSIVIHCIDYRLKDDKQRPIVAYLSDYTKTYVDEPCDMLNRKDVYAMSEYAYTKYWYPYMNGITYDTWGPIASCNLMWS